jgi:hypothetical protein
VESGEDKDIARITALLPAEGKRKKYSFEHLVHDIEEQLPEM